MAKTRELCKDIRFGVMRKLMSANGGSHYSLRTDRLPFMATTVCHKSLQQHRQRVARFITSCWSEKKKLLEETEKSINTAPKWISAHSYLAQCGRLCEICYTHIVYHSSHLVENFVNVCLFLLFSFQNSLFITFSTEWDRMHSVLKYKNIPNFR